MCASGGPADFGRYDEPLERYVPKKDSQTVVLPARKMKRWSVGLDGRTIKASEGPNDADLHRQSQFGVTVSYRPAANLFLAARMPFTRMTQKELGEPEEKNSGLGDTEFLATHNFALKRTAWRPGVTVGVKVPTGDNNLKTDDSDASVDRLDEHGQLGSGTVDGMLMAHLRRGGMYRFSSTLGYRVNGENGSGYRYGSIAWLDCSVSRSIYKSLSAGLGTRLRYSDRNSESGEKEFHSGGTMFLITPEVGYSFGNSLNLSAQCSLPVINELNGEQSEAVGLSVALTQTF